MSELLALDRVSAGYGEAIVISDIDLRSREGAALARARPQRHRQDDAPQHHHRRHAAARRQHPLAGRDLTGAAAGAARALPASAGCRRSATSSSRSPSRRTSPRSPGRDPGLSERVYELFPRLKERRANLGNQLSGGEQQMLAIAPRPRAQPALMLLDEPTEGLAPIIVEELLAALKRIIRDEGLAAIIVEQHAQKILDVTDHAIILERGTHRACRARAVR